MVLAVIVTSGSMLINDYHDYIRGVDTIESKPGRPLVTGEISPHLVKRALKWLYAVHLTGICLVTSAPTRLWVLGSTMLTYFYTPWLKPRMGLKNLWCGSIVAMALGLGAITIAGFVPGLAAVWRPMLVLLCGISHREAVMDIKDADGDAMAGVRTVAVVLGRSRALSVSLLPLALGTAAAAGGSYVAAAPLLVMASLAVRTRSRDFDAASLRLTIESAPLWLLCSMTPLML